MQVRLASIRAVPMPAQRSSTYTYWKRAIEHVHMLEAAVKLPYAWEAAMKMPVHPRRGQR
jgi:hypothetical protein